MLWREGLGRWRKILVVSCAEATKDLALDNRPGEHVFLRQFGVEHWPQSEMDCSTMSQAGKHYHLWTRAAPLEGQPGARGMILRGLPPRLPGPVHTRPRRTKLW